LIYLFASLAQTQPDLAAEAVLGLFPSPDFTYIASSVRIWAMESSGLIQ
jgi:hypothetical protein